MLPVRNTLVTGTLGYVPTESPTAVEPVGYIPFPIETTDFITSDPATSDPATSDMEPEEEKAAIEHELSKNPDRKKKRATVNKGVYKVPLKPGSTSLTKDLVDLANSWKEGDKVLYDFECSEVLEELLRKHKLV